MSMHIVVTGGAGFIGSNFIRFVHQHRDDYRITNLDTLTYAADLEGLAHLEGDARYALVRADICDREAVSAAMRNVDAVVHFAAESHVDRSIEDSTPFVRTNVLGTQVLLDVARQTGLNRFVHVSTDEVYGELPLDTPDVRFTEDTPIQPNSPYAASKAASDLLVRSFVRTFGMNCSITRCSNNFGPYQFPEKVIPYFVTNLLEGRKLPLYGDGRNVRDWIHVDDHCEGVLAVLERGEAGEVYNIGGNNERSNLELTHSILQIMGKDESWIDYVKDRPGHDRRYAIDASKIERELGWRPTRSAWPQALEQTVAWYCDHPQWWQRVRRGERRDGSARR